MAAKHLQLAHMLLPFKSNLTQLAGGHLATQISMKNVNPYLKICKTLQLHANTVEIDCTFSILHQHSISFSAHKMCSTIY